MTTTYFWYGVIVAITGAFALALRGVWLARRGRGRLHARMMIASTAVISAWLISYVTKQLLHGRDLFQGSLAAYYTLYLPVLILHVSLALATMAAWGYNLYLGLRYSREEGGKRVLPNLRERHRRCGIGGLVAFGGTLITAYVVYILLFVWYPPRPMMARDTRPAATVSHARPSGKQGVDDGPYRVSNPSLAPTAGANP